MKARARIANTQFYCPISRLPVYAVIPIRAPNIERIQLTVKIPSNPTNFSDIGEKKGMSKWRCPDVVKKNPAQWDFIGS